MVILACEHGIPFWLFRATSGDSKRAMAVAFLLESLLRLAFLVCILYWCSLQLLTITVLPCNLFTYRLSMKGERPVTIKRWRRDELCRCLFTLSYLFLCHTKWLYPLYSLMVTNFATIIVWNFLLVFWRLVQMVSNSVCVQLPSSHPCLSFFCFQF